MHMRVISGHIGLIGVSFELMAPAIRDRLPGWNWPTRIDLYETYWSPFPLALVTIFLQRFLLVLYYLS